MERTVYISLKAIDDVKRFVEAMNAYSGRTTLALDNYRVDAKSIISVLGLDLSQKLRLEINGKENGEILKVIEPYIVQLAVK